MTRLVYKVNEIIVTQKVLIAKLAFVILNVNLYRGSYYGPNI